MHWQISPSILPENKSGGPYGRLEDSVSVFMGILDNLQEFSPSVNRLPTSVKTDSSPVVFTQEIGRDVFKVISEVMPD